jgi:hypothetical protein
MVISISLFLNHVKPQSWLVVHEQQRAIAQSAITYTLEEQRRLHGLYGRLAFEQDFQDQPFVALQERRQVEFA